MPPPELTPLPPESAHRAGVVDADALQADAFRARRHAQSDASQSSATLGAPQHLLGEQRPITLHFDVDIVFDRQRDHVLRGEIQVAGAESDR